MAIFKPGPIVQAITGTVGGTNFVVSARSVYLRRARIGNSNQRKSQLDIQTHMIQLTRAWNDLTDAQRRAWQTTAAAVPTKNKLGIPITLNGREFFFQRNLRNLCFGIYGYNATPPSIIGTTPPYGGAIANPSSGVITLTWSNLTLGGFMSTMLWGARSYTTAPQRTFKRWQILTGAFVYPYTFDLYALFTSSIFNPALGAPGQDEQIAVRIIQRYGASNPPNYLDSTELVVTGKIIHP